MTKKQLQQQTNALVLKEFEKFNRSNPDLRPVERLRTCTAYVFETDCYYVLKSYNTIVAIIDKKDDMCYDFLRYFWGYSNTSAKHIAYFQSDYGIRGKVMIYREV